MTNSIYKYLFLLLIVPAVALAQGYNVPFNPRGAGGGGGGWCDGFSDLWCESFEETSDNCTGEGGTGDAPDNLAGSEYHCDCSTSANCEEGANGTLAASIPDGSHVLELGPEDGGFDDDRIEYQSQWTAASDDIAYMRFCMYWDAADANQDSNLIRFQSGAGEWSDTGTTTTLDINSSTGELTICCSTNFIPSCGSTSALISLDTWHEITLGVDDSSGACDIDLWVDKGTADAADANTTGEIGQDWDGVEFMIEGLQSAHDATEIKIDGIRVTDGAPGSTVGCS